jgi:streptogramin lyase
MGMSMMAWKRMDRTSSGRVGVIAGAVGLALAATLTGCGTGLSGGTGTGVATAALKVSGSVHGGQQPIVGATIQLYAVGTSGSKSASTALIGSTVTTGSNGSFSLPAYSCGTSTDVYLVATGGDSGSGANGAISLMAALGSCTSSLTLPYVQVNELTTVASVYALAPFMADYAHVGAANTTSAQTGISNAFATVNNLVSVTSGSAPGAALPAGATVPTAELNTLADILAACVNTSGSTSSGCSSLLTATGATETIGAALGIANHPGTAVSTLYPLATPASPFQPTLSAAPNDFTVAIKFSGNGLATPYGVALDANGRVWVANESGNSVTRLSNAGAPAGNYTGVLAPRAIAIDKLGNAWVANTSQSNVVEISALGTPIGTFTAGGINAPESIAIDSGNQVWVANGNGNSITSLNQRQSAHWQREHCQSGRDCPGSGRQRLGQQHRSLERGEVLECGRSPQWRRLYGSVAAASSGHRPGCERQCLCGGKLHQRRQRLLQQRNCVGCQPLRLARPAGGSGDRRLGGRVGHQRNLDWLAGQAGWFREQHLRFSQYTGSAGRG